MTWLKDIECCWHFTGKFFYCEGLSSIVVPTCCRLIVPSKFWDNQEMLPDISKRTSVSFLSCFFFFLASPSLLYLSIQPKSLPSLKNFLPWPHFPFYLLQNVLFPFKMKFLSNYFLPIEILLTNSWHYFCMIQCIFWEKIWKILKSW